MQSIEEKKPFDVIIEINKFLGFELQTTERYKANQKQRNGLIAQSKHKKIVRKEFVFCLFGVISLHFDTVASCCDYNM